MIGQYDVVCVHPEVPPTKKIHFLVRNVTRVEAERVVACFMRDKPSMDFENVRVIRHGTLQQVVKTMNS